MKTANNPTLQTAIDTARDMRALMDDVYDGEREESEATTALAVMFDQVLPYYQAMFDVNAWAAEQVANTAEWLDRLDDLPDTV